MSHFRKMLFAAAAMVASFVGSTGTASAQSNPFVCNTSFSPLVVRVEGLRELVGDIVISCTGGNGVALQAGQTLVYLQPNALNNNVPAVSSSPTATTYAVGTGTTGDLPGCWLNRVLQTSATTSTLCGGIAGAAWSTGTGTFTGLTVPAINISVTIAGTRITNRIFSSSNLTDALLFIDDPTNPAAGGTTTNQNPCAGTGGVCTGLQYFYNTSGVAVGAGVANSSFTVTTPLNVFQAQYGVGGGFVPNEQTITFVGVPIVQPGTGNGTRTYRIKNIRVQVANAFQVNGQIQAFISIQNPPANLVLNNAQGVVGFVQRGLFFDTIAGGPYAQCLGWNTSSGSYAVELTSGTRNSVLATGALRFTEAYGVSFKRRGVGGTLDAFDTTFNPYYLATYGQSNPTVNYNNESGFYNLAYTTTNGLSSAGIASNGTRLRARFSGIPSQVRVYVSAQPVTVADPNSCSSTSGGIQRTSSTSSRLLCIGQGTAAPNAAYSLTTSATTDGAVEGFTANTSNVFSVTGGALVQGSTAPGWGGNGAAYTGLTSSAVTYQRVSIAADGTGTFFWEVLRADDNVIDRFDFLVAISFPPTTSIVTDATTSVTANVSGSYAPIAATGGNGYPSVPSFILPQPEDPKAIFSITNCATNLLYPFVSSVTGFNTGIAVTNASKDPFGTVNETGICRVFFYGTTTGGGIDPTPQPFTKSVPSGQVATFNLLFGGPEYGIQPVVGFQGYIIISCNFRWAHGFAFISDPSNLQTAQGYLALILDTPGLLRGTGATSEALDN